MDLWTRRNFLVEVGRGMMTASLGLATASELGLAATAAGDDPPRLLFGSLEPLVDLMIETPAAELNGVIASKLKSGTTVRELVAAAALANARTFGGENYVGFHTMMALGPAYRMSLELPEARRPLPVMKVLYRNTNNIQATADAKNPKAARPDVLAPVAGRGLPSGRNPADVLRDAVRASNLGAAEEIFASIARGGGPREAFDALMKSVQDVTEVHRVALPHRAWDLVEIVGAEHAHTLLRQSLHYCVQNESRMSDKYRRVRALLPKVLDEHGLVGKAPGARVPDDAWVARTSREIFEGSPESAAGVAAAALAEGIAPEAVGEAIALAANQLLLRDAGRQGKEAQPGKGAGSVHGDSIGLHACDSANAWRGMARAGNAKNTIASLVLGAYQAAFDRVERGGDFLKWEPYPRAEHLARVEAKDAPGLLREAEAAIRANDQARACAAIHRYGELGAPEQPAFDLLLGFAVSEDGALHAEKYYRTAREEFAAARPAFRWRHACSLARVTASEFGQPAPGQAQARELLGV